MIAYVEALLERGVHKRSSFGGDNSLENSNFMYYLFIVAY